MGNHRASVFPDERSSSRMLVWSSNQTRSTSLLTCWLCEWLQSRDRLGPQTNMAIFRCSVALSKRLRRSCKRAPALWPTGGVPSSCPHRLLRIYPQLAKISLSTRGDMTHTHTHKQTNKQTSKQTNTHCTHTHTHTIYVRRQPARYVQTDSAPTTGRNFSLPHPFKLDIYFARH